jgi:hypothetical protein
MKLHQDEEEKESQIRMKCNEQTRQQMTSDKLDWAVIINESKKQKKQRYGPAYLQRMYWLGSLH